MDRDLQDLVAAWLRNSDLSASRRDELLARLRSDNGFRREFVEEIQMHGYVRAAQSSEPRWPLLEEAMGGHEDGPGLEDSIMARLAQMPTPRRQRTWNPWWAVTGFAVVAVGVFLAVQQANLGTKPAVPPTPPSGGMPVSPPAIAMLSHVVEAAWADGEPDRIEGAELPTGWLRLALGTVQVDLFSGARLFIEGPAQLELRSPNEAFLLSGKVACELNDSARGFRLLTPGLTVVNQGNSFGVKVSESGEQEVHALEGKVTIGRTGESGTSQILAKQARRLDDTGFAETPFRPEDFPAFERVREREQAEAARLLLAWRAAADALDGDPAVRVHFNFEEQSPLDATLRNRVRGDGAGSDGQIIGARWAQGRWPGKGALEFRGRGQRVLLRLPGMHNSLTLLAWVRVDTLPQPVTTLLATDEPPREEANGGKPSPADARPVRWELKANGQLGFNLFSGLVSGQPQWSALPSPPLLTPERHGQWLCLATVLDAARGELTHFINGVAVARHKPPPGPPLALAHLSLGNLSATDAEARLGVNYGFFGAVDEVLVAERPFSAAELRRYYEVGRP
ncbi:MAG: FecR protein domain protein [Limisphaerales bacterium]|nr:MAG: FecR protein domain protein [Limisphaerales bacterium]KAG0509858.1 MAG: FecR protein domain protein [Limisphaerales bacterium]TXT50920.1 MAG: FecR protein domain protein [Limisphaerales bacterium]